MATSKPRDAIRCSRRAGSRRWRWPNSWRSRSEEHTSELQSRLHLVCRLLLEKKKIATFVAISVHLQRLHTDMRFATQALILLIASLLRITYVSWLINRYAPHRRLALVHIDQHVLHHNYR